MPSLLQAVEDEVRGLLDSVNGGSGEEATIALGL